MKRVLRLIPPLLVVVLFGCSSDKIIGGFPREPALTPNDSPRNTMLRLVETYERKKAQEYQDLFTTDFTFEFSNSTDPVLVQKYSTGWFKSDEAGSASHLFQGYTPPGESYKPAAASINIDLTSTLPFDDGAPGVDPNTHKVDTTRVNGKIVIPAVAPATDPKNYEFKNNVHHFYLVRGDVALLGPGQASDSLHWYVYRWLDLTTPSFSPTFGQRPLSPEPAQEVTWGKIKALYL